MLLRLSLEDFFLIKGAEVYFDRGFNVITGETGTGKSLTLSSLLFLMGQEGNYPEGTSVELELLYEGENTVLRREVSKGRSRFYLNGRGSNRKVLEEILSSSVLIQGQNDRTRVVRADFQREVYDRFAGTLELRKKVEEVYQKLYELEDKIRLLKEEKVQREVRKRLLQEEILQLEQVGLRPEEYESLKNRLDEINRAEKINRLVFEALSGVETSLQSLGRSLRAIRELSGLKSFSQSAERLELFLDFLTELERELSSASISYSQEELDTLNEKLFKVQRLERKYGRAYPELWLYLQELKGQLMALEREEDEEHLLRERHQLETQLEEHYNQLSKARQRSSGDFEQRVMDYLRSMGLERASFRVAFEEKAGRYGKEQVRFLFSSYGKEEKELGEVASGGEISRISLALFMLSPPAQTYVLDEVDTGISGETSLRLAKLLRELSENTQLIVITHSPALASAGDKHITTKKEFVKDHVCVTIKELKGEERLFEIARLMGKVSEKTLESARELIREFSALV